MANTRRSIGYLLAAIIVVTGCLLLAFQQQRTEAVRAAARTGSAVNALTAMLDQETGVRGFLDTGREDFLEPYLIGRSGYEQARVEVAAAASGDPQSEQLAAAEDAAARSWQSYAERAVADRRTSAFNGGAASQEVLGKQQMDRFRAMNGRLRDRLDERRNSTLRDSGELATAAVVLIAAALATAGLLAVQRSSRRAVERGQSEIDYRIQQGEFSDLIQSVESEPEAHQLVQRHLKRSITGAEVNVLIRNNSDNRLQASTGLPAESALAASLIEAEPRSCLAIRLGRGHEDGTAKDLLLSCTVCSSAAGTATCEPLLVGGKVIGSVLIRQPEPLADEQRRALRDTVALAAPVLANLKTIAMAENRASTDALTGLPNRRAMGDTLKRMAAHAGRTGTPLSAIAFDLDHFKSINDRYGHELGDAALSAVGECLRDTVRDSDFAARIGGEEFLVLAPDTDLDGALVLAEKVREALTREEVPQLPQSLTASFGVACIPLHAGSAEVLLRRADRACYLAKDRGRNRIEVATDEEWSMPPTPGQPNGAPAGLQLEAGNRR